MPPTENNHHGNQRLLLILNAAVEAEKNIRRIKAAVQPVSGSLNPKTFVGMLVGNPSTKMAGGGSIFQYEESNCMLSESMEEYALASIEADYEDPGEQATTGFMAVGGGFHDGNDSHW